MRGPRALLPLLLALALSLGACERASLPFAHAPAPGASATPRAATATPAPSPTARALPDVPLDSLKGTQLTLWHALPYPLDSLLNGQVAQFNAQNPWGITARAEGQPGYPELFDATTAALENSSRPDAVITLPEQIRAWAADGAVADLAPYFNDHQVGYTADQQADFPAVFLEQDRLDGQLLGMPAQRSARLLFYNETWGRLLDFSAPPLTPTDFSKQACAGNASFKRDGDLTNDGYGGWIVDTDWQSALAWMDAYGGSVYGDGKYTFMSDPNQAALEAMKGLYDSNCAWLSTEALTHDQFARRLALFSTGDLSELDAQTAAFGRASADTAEDNWTVLAFPGEQGTAIVTYGPSYAVLRSDPKRELASWLFIKWLLEPERLAQWVRVDGLFPLRSSEIAELTDYANTHPQWAEAVRLLRQAQTVPQTASWRTMKYVLGDGTNYIFRVNLPITQIPGVLRQMDSTAKELGAK